MEVSGLNGIVQFVISFARANVLSIFEFDAD
jgi:hypothetical protein